MFLYFIGTLHLLIQAVLTDGWWIFMTPLFPPAICLYWIKFTTYVLWHLYLIFIGCEQVRAQSIDQSHKLLTYLQTSVFHLNYKSVLAGGKSKK